MVKLNVDGSCIEGVTTRCGRIVRDDKGCWLGGFAKNVYICSRYMDELWGLLEGLILVLDLRLRRVEVNMDSSEIMLEINQGRSRRSEGLEMLKKFWSLLSRFEEAYVKHVFRESNRCMDALAKSRCRLNRNLQRYPIAHTFIEKLIVEDVERGFFSREVIL